MKFIPLDDTVIVEPAIKNENQTEAGIILQPDKKGPQYGTVYAVGPGKYENGKMNPTAVKVGQQVIFLNKLEQAVPVTLDGIELLALKERDIIGIYK